MPPALEAESGGALRLARGQQGRSLGHSRRGQA
jgi:hypothetical protein